MARQDRCEDSNPSGRDYWLVSTTCVVILGLTLGVEHELRLYWPGGSPEPSLEFELSVAISSMLLAGLAWFCLMLGRWWHGAIVGFVLGMALIPLSGVPEGWRHVFAPTDALRALGLAFSGALAYIGAAATGLYSGVWLALLCHLSERRRRGRSPGATSLFLMLTSGGLAPVTAAVLLLSQISPYGVESFPPHHAVYWVGTLTLGLLALLCVGAIHFTRSASAG
jgi:hypothetical protein